MPRSSAACWSITNNESPLSQMRYPSNAWPMTRRFAKQRVPSAGAPTGGAGRRGHVPMPLAGPSTAGGSTPGNGVDRVGKGGGGGGHRDETQGPDRVARRQRHGDLRGGVRGRSGGRRLSRRRLGAQSVVD